MDGALLLLYIGTDTRASPPMIKILHIDDSRDDLELTGLQLGRLSEELKIDGAESGTEALEILASDSYDCILCDYQMPRVNGMEVLLKVRERGDTTPFIFLTGQGNEDLAVEAFRCGADDYFTKEIGFAHYDRLLNSIIRVVESHEQNLKHLRAVKALEESELQYRSILDTTTDTFLIFDSNGNIVEANSRACEMYGYPHDELTGLSGKDIVHPDYYNLFEQFKLDVQASGEFRAESVDIRNDGTKFDIEVKGTEFQYRDKPHLLAVVRDITERKKAEAALRESEVKYRAIFDAADAAIFVHDIDTGAILDVNRKTCELYGYTPEEVRRLSMGDFSSGRSPYTQQEALQRIRKAVEGEPQLFEWQAKDKAGRLFWVEAKLKRATIGRNDRLLAVVRDITERKRAEEELREHRDQLELRTGELEAVNKELEAFSYSVSHDLRAPLRHIEGFSQALLEDYGGKLDDKGREYVEKVITSGRRLSRLVNDLLKLASLTRGKLQVKPVDLSSIAREVAETLRGSEPKRKVELEIADGSAANADPLLIRAVLENLLGNAWKFTAKKKKAKIEFGVTESEGRQAYFVRDNGVGFDQAKADKLFAPFARLHADREFEGHGIGLATVQRIVSRHGGRAWAEGLVGKGAVFYFTLG